MTEIERAEAKRIHEQWVRMMQDRGWSYGPEYDEAAKKDPNMVPFEQLPAEDQGEEEPAEEPEPDTTIQPDADDQESGDDYVGETGPAPAVQEPETNG